MKTPGEFKRAVYQKRDARLQKRNRNRKRAALFCVPLLCAATLLAVLPFLFPGGGSLFPSMKSSGGNAGSHRAEEALLGEPSLEILAAESPEDLSLRALTLERVKKAPRDYATTSEIKESEKEEQEITEERERRADLLEENLVDPEFPAAVNGFARDSSARLAKDFEENACYSPLSLYYALALAGSGARGETEREFLELLNAPDLDWLSGQCAKYYRQQYHDNPFSQFRIANSLWLDGGTDFQESFLSGARDNFYASLFLADYSNPALGSEMGGWISDHTNGLLSPALTTSPWDRLTVLNTVYLYDEWIRRFEEEDNTKEPFTRSGGDEVTATYLHATEYGGALRGSGFTRASIGLKECGEMVFILPDEGASPQDLLSDPQTFEEMFFPKSWGEFQSYEIEWSIPKFSFSDELDLSEALVSLGLDTAFDGERADFQGISSSKEPLFLSAAKQGVRIGIDENGVEAAAYTELGLSGTGEIPTENLEMKLDRPFLFAILSRDQLTESGRSERPQGGTLLFVGVCGNPAGK